jgi:excisionase family DNA binding protein
MRVSPWGGVWVFGYFFFGGNMDKKETEETTFDITGAAEFLKLSKWSIYQMTRRKEIPCHKPHGGKLVFFKSELEAFIRGDKKQCK